MNIALIPARSGSKGFPHKNIAKLGGFSLLHWSIIVCLKSKLIDRVFVSTDSDEYASLAKKCGAEAPFLRPKNISRDYSTDIEFINHALNYFESNNIFPEIIVHIRPTTPIRKPEVIDEAIKIFLESPKASSLRSVHQMSETAYKNFEIDSKKILKCVFSGNYDLDITNGPRQKFPQTYCPNGYVDVLSTKYIKETKKLHGSNCLSFITNVATEVDTKDDFDYLEYQLEKNPAVINLFKS